MLINEFRSFRVLKPLALTVLIDTWKACNQTLLLLLRLNHINLLIYVFMLPNDKAGRANRVKENGNPK